MHLEILLEEPSAEKVMKNILPSIITGDHTFKCIVYQGKNDLLKKLPSQLAAYKKWIPDHYRIIILVDRDNEDCKKLKAKLDQCAVNAGLKCKSNPKNIPFQILNRIAIEEIESWFFGDPDAVRLAYPRLTLFENKAQYRNPDNIVNTWETLENLLQQKGYFKTGLRKSEAAYEISLRMQPLNNRSHSFQIFWSGISDCLV
ncbi:MAG: DUF4276 family protein [Bacteroidota bacterium]